MCYPPIASVLLNREMHQPLFDILESRENMEQSAVFQGSYCQIGLEIIGYSMAGRDVKYSSMICFQPPQKQRIAASYWVKIL